MMSAKKYSVALFVELVALRIRLGSSTMANLNQYTPNEQTKGTAVIRLTSLTQWSGRILSGSSSVLLRVRSLLENLRGLPESESQISGLQDQGYGTSLHTRVSVGSDKPFECLCTDGGPTVDEI